MEENLSGRSALAYKDVLRFLSGDRALYNSRCAEHRRNRRWSSSLRRPTTKGHIDGDDNIRKTKQQIVWQSIYSPAVNDQLIRNKTGRNNPGMAIGPATAGLNGPARYAILLRSRSFVATRKVFDREILETRGMPKARTSQDESREPAAQDCHGRAARGQRNDPPALATTCSSHRSDCLRLAIDDSK
jgi:hypothetical protein